MRDSLLRVIDYLETKREEALHHELMQREGYWHGYFTGASNSLGLAIEELRKVLDEHEREPIETA